MKYKTCGEETNISGMSFYNCDNIKLLKETPDNYYSLCIVDPPFGTGKSIMNITATPKERKNKRIKKREEKDWDVAPTKEYFDELFRVSQNQIIWGANYYDHLKGSRGWIFWDKKYENTFNFSAGELAYTSFDKPLKKVNVSNRKMPYMSFDNIHPTQKPVALYKWLLKNYAKEGDKILDTHMGSGSIAIACHYMGFDLTACELDKEYYDQAMERITNQTRQETLI